MVTIAYGSGEAPPQAEGRPALEFQSDIPFALAIAAWGEDALARLSDYAQRLASDLAELSPLADTDEKRSVLESEFFEYRRGSQVRMIAFLTGLARKASPAMIGGPTRYPAPKGATLGAAAELRKTELANFRTRALARIKEVLRPEPGPVVDGPGDKLAELRAKLAAAEAHHEHMKAANAAIRRCGHQGRDAQLAALIALGLEQIAAEALLVPFQGRLGYRELKMRTSLSEIGRISRRIEGVIAARARGMTEERGVRARLELVPAERCIRMFFNGSPGKKVHRALKEAGFEPRSYFWHGRLADETVAIARKLAGIEAP